MVAQKRRWARHSGAYHLRSGYFVFTAVANRFEGVAAAALPMRLKSLNRIFTSSEPLLIAR